MGGGGVRAPGGDLLGEFRGLGFLGGEVFVEDLKLGAALGLLLAFGFFGVVAALDEFFNASFSDADLGGELAELFLGGSERGELGFEGLGLLGELLELCLGGGGVFAEFGELGLLGGEVGFEALELDGAFFARGDVGDEFGEIAARSGGLGHVRRQGRFDGLCLIGEQSVLFLGGAEVSGELIEFGLLGGERSFEGFEFAAALGLKLGLGFFGVGFASGQLGEAGFGAGDVGGELREFRFSGRGVRSPLRQ